MPKEQKPQEHQLTIWVSTAVHHRLRVIAAERDYRSLSALGVDIIHEWLAAQWAQTRDVPRDDEAGHG